MLRGNSILKYIILFIFLVFAQVAVLNRISLFNLATPIVYTYLIIKLPIAMNRNLITVLGFILGLTIDIFCNTPGINAAATTLIAFARRPIQSLFFVVDDFEEQIPALKKQRAIFLKYTFAVVFVHLSILMSIEAFSYFNLKLVILRIITSTILSTIIIFAFEGLSFTRKDEKSS